MGVQVEKRLLTIEEYHKMGEVGILEEKGLELIKGEIIKMSPVSKEHLGYVNHMSNLFMILLQGKAVISPQNPILIQNNSEPQPDISILKYRKDSYIGKYPTAEDAILVIEVALSTLMTDRELKAPLYAEAGIPEYWIINLEDQQIEAHRNPSENTYQIKEIAQKGDQLQIPGFDSYVEIDKVFMN